MSKTILFIDVENFINKLEDVLEEKSISKNRIDLALIDFNKLFNKPLQEFQFSRKIFYAAKLNIHPETKKKSEELIQFQRKLRNSLVNQGFEFVMAGNVRGQKIGGRIIFNHGRSR